ncbi:hypothetical protein, partial [Leptolyngbya sp. FACHB-16]|uniref:hypothetical protein n=1 Tax=unclassified Leptolyngbya TaxID=2650499 RepID=UPI00168359A5
MEMLPIDPKEYYGPVVEELQKLRKEVTELRRENQAQRQALAGLYQTNMKLRQTRRVLFEVMGDDRTSFSSHGDGEPGAVR